MKSIYDHLSARDRRLVARWRDCERGRDRDIAGGGYRHRGAATWRSTVGRDAVGRDAGREQNGELAGPA